MPLTPYKGSCHCGLIRFTAHLDFSTQRTSKCNCSSCQKTRAWEITCPPSHFQLEDPSSEAHLTDYTFGSHQAHHLFCSRCGVRAFGRVDAWPGVEGGFVSVSVACLDGVADEELVKWGERVVFRNGREGRFREEPAVTGYL
ncbi:hypothetical protein Q7P37_011286 [Cladosporium fusiforme]